jgi:4-amino-4-deoxy-L-arabinose transferase-like glycosyltransferase
MPSHRLVHYLVLAAVTALLTLPNLGAHSLWDMDEGVNAECTREMLEAGTWVVPTFNWELRTAKPILTYWLQRPAYLAFGVSEWSARLPSALLAIGTVLLTYELGRRMFGPATGLLAGVALASAVQFCILSHAATPDAPLIFFTVLTFYLVWVGHENGGRRWVVPAGVASGLAVLSKGPVGLALPGLAVAAYFVWNREWRRVFDPRLAWGFLVFALVAGPWYALVTAETKGEYIEEFFGNHNVNRFLTPMENHRGPVVYYVVALVILFAPWSCFLGATLWYAIKGARTSNPDPGSAVPGLSTQQRAYRFLLCWFLAYLVFFSAAQTKLPNYIAPLYPAAALLTAHFLVRWREGAVAPARWVMPAGAAGVALTGVLLAAGLVVASGVLPLSLKGMRTFPGLEWWAWVGLVPLAGAAVMAQAVRAGDRGRAVVAVAAAAVVTVGVVAAGPPLVVDRYKAAKELVLTSGARQPDRDIRLAALLYFQDSQSIVFYAGRRVEVLHAAEQVNAFLAMPHPSYLFVPGPVWEEHFAGRSTTPPHRIAARKYDFYRNAEILVVTNEPDRAAVAAATAR